MVCQPGHHGPVVPKHVLMGLKLEQENVSIETVATDIILNNNDAQILLVLLRQMAPFFNENPVY